jgi:thioredoxin 1
MIAPFVDRLALEMAGRLRVAKLNVDEHPNVSRGLDVQSIPALLAFKDRREAGRIIGAISKAEIATRLKRWAE